jgi:hypothetical protein
MMNLIRAAVISTALLVQSVWATEIDSTGNLITNTWDGVVNSTTITSGDGSHTTGSGPTPVYNPDTNTITFSYSQYTASQVIGINAALSAAGTGLQVHGFSYGWEYYNQEWNRGTLSGSISLTNSSNQLLENYSYSMPHTTNGWTAMSGTQNFNNVYAASGLGNLSVSFTGRDDRFWAGYYGPMIRNVDVRLRYSIDPCVADPQSSPSCSGFKTYYNISDDSYAIVALPFSFPFYGKLFTHSLFFDNGLVSFYSPNLYPQRFGGQQFWAEPLNDNLGSQFHYSIMPLWTDLLNYNGSFYTQGDSNYLRYTWDNVSQWGYPDRLNTFSLEIRPTGYIGVQYDKINIGGYPVTAGYVGNAELGEWSQRYYSSDPVTTGTISNWSTNQTVAIDCSNALSHPNCPGYEQAFYDQQCDINALYDSGCPGYQQAYFDQQCSINALYSNSCPGYQQAYFDQQCSINPLYNNKCPGFAVAKALKDQQDQQKEESSTEVIASTTTSTISTVDQSLVDPTRTETVVVIDVGGVELSLTGEIAAPTGQTQSAKEAAKDAEKEEAKKEEEKKQTNPRALALARSAAAAATRLAESRAQEAVQLSQLDQSVGDAIGLGTGITLQGFRPIGTDQENTEEIATSEKSTSQNSLDMQAGNDTKANEVPGSQPPTGPSVRRGGAVEGMDGGPNIDEMARAPMDFNQYLNSQLTDSRFYESKEIYRGQRTVDNARAQRFLNAASDRLHQEMVDQQYGR